MIDITIRIFYQYPGEFMNDADYWVKTLELAEHPEGGYFRETYRSMESVSKNALPGRYDGPRVFSTAIYFLVSYSRPSRFHRLQSDELWHFYEGYPLTISVILEDGSFHTIILGRNRDKGEHFQEVIKAGTWFGAMVHEKNEFALCGCQVAPGFEYTDFELGNTQKLIESFPKHRDIILKINGKG